MTSTLEHDNARRCAKGTARLLPALAIGFAILIAGLTNAQEDAAPSVVWVVANDDASPVFLYNSPHEGDRSTILTPGTLLAVLSDEVEGDGQRWYVVRAPDEREGYVEVLSTTPAEPDPPRDGNP